MEFRPYSREVYYYETDRMNIVHHSNYIRWLEEARIDLLGQMGISFPEIEKRGLMIPALSAGCEYKYPLRFGDRFEIRCRIESFNGCRFSLSYEIFNASAGKPSAAAVSAHCFTDGELRPVRLKKGYRDIYEIFEKAAYRDKNGKSGG
ncbi:thioesterase family protein [Ruminococcus sp. Marseille-P6503]|uniref:acyl-CoA thioesterase n=1 Tax=Ruminococcus sp. Marseille-P6503 TaxID=2364796 RepID=UPI000F531FFC|nr:thioesterase family protein [Ruminococcus sp. Marseille-P6503]